VVASEASRDPRAEAAPRAGWVGPRLAAEFPGLGISWVELTARPRRSPDQIRHRLRVLSDRFFGAQAIHMRERPIPWAYRVFYRHIGLDPDETRTPVEQLALERLHDGGFKSHGLPADALAIATIETGVALRAFDAERLQGRLGIRDSAPGESLPGRPADLPQGTLTIADERGPIGLLFGESGEGYEVGSATTRIAVVAIAVNGVPDIAVDEALWTASTVIASTQSP
jgi:DNA/RNA-binding domain of Phe-tRNA-synthetase-like protein